jgi:hypothetical protein
MTPLKCLFSKQKHFPNTMKSTVFWIVTPCSLAIVYRLSEESTAFIFWEWPQQAKFLTLRYLLAYVTLRIWRRKKHLLLKYGETSAKVTSLSVLTRQKQNNSCKKKKKFTIQQVGCDGPGPSFRANKKGWLILQPWRWRRYVPPKHRLTFTALIPDVELLTAKILKSNKKLWIQNVLMIVMTMTF